LAILETRIQNWPDEATCQHSAHALAARLGKEGALIELHGDLGAGKTTFVRYLLHSLGVKGRVKSPTYGLMEVYELPNLMLVSHCDFYRFNSPQEWEDAGLREVFSMPGLKLVEWPEKASSLLPVPDMQLVIGAGSVDERVVQWHACTAHGLGLLP
jgi:tRNA threonylcarbamoyladenosine biosynthesis protein TsaE